jgi:acetylornithine deacetylase/succinyl-diaminopimelate desuccinylase-like protein
MATRPDLKELCRAEFAGAVSDLQRLVRQPSVAAQNRGIGETVQLLYSMIEAAGGRCEVLTEGVPGNPFVYAEFEGQSDRTLLLYNHYDVQPPEPLEEWTVEPFGGEVKDGKLYGRGAADNKIEIAARLAAIRALREQNGGVLPCRVKWLIEGEEEIGSPSFAAGIKYHAERLKADACIWETGSVRPDGRPDLAGGCKGMVYLQLRMRYGEADLHSGAAAYAQNPAWRLLWALSTVKGPDGRVLVKGFYDGIKPPTPAEEEAVRRMGGDIEGVRRSLGEDWPLLVHQTPELLRAIVFEPTCNIAGLTAGYGGPGQKTIVPREAQAKIDCRLVPGQDPQQIYDAFVNHFRQNGFPDVEVELTSMVPPWRQDPAHPFVDLCLRTAREAWGTEPVYSVSVGASGPPGYLADLHGLPIVALGCSYYGGRAHAPDEHIRLADLQTGIYHMALLIQEFGR